MPLFSAGQMEYGSSQFHLQTVKIRGVSKVIYLQIRMITHGNMRPKFSKPSITTSAIPCSHSQQRSMLLARYAPRAHVRTTGIRDCNDVVGVKSEERGDSVPPLFHSHCFVATGKYGPRGMGAGDAKWRHGISAPASPLSPSLSYAHTRYEWRRRGKPWHSILSLLFFNGHFCRCAMHTHEARLPFLHSEGMLHIFKTSKTAEQ